MTDIHVEPEERQRSLVRPDGRTLAWAESGVLDGRPILRLPGTPGSRLQVRSDQTPWIDRGLRMILTERPGFGASTRHVGRTFDDHADDLAAILDELEIDSVPILGASGAAPYLLAFAAQHPDRVRAVTVLVGSAPVDDEEAELMIGVNREATRLAKAGDRDGMIALSSGRSGSLCSPIHSPRSKGSCRRRRPVTKRSCETPVGTDS